MVLMIALKVSGCDLVDLPFIILIDFAGIHGKVQDNKVLLELFATG
jgi:hypothetical protein